MISAHIQGKPFNTTVIQVYAPTSNAEEAEIEWFYEDIQDLLELTPPKDVLFNIWDWNAKVVVPVWFYSFDCPIPRREGGHLVLPLSC